MKDELKQNKTGSKAFIFNCCRRRQKKEQAKTVVKKKMNEKNRNGSRKLNVRMQSENETTNNSTGNEWIKKI